MPAWLLVAVAMSMLLNIGVRAGGVAAALILGWFIVSNFDLARSLIANMNAVKREYAFFAASLVLIRCGGGELFSVRGARSGWKRLLQPGLGQREPASQSVDAMPPARAEVAMDRDSGLGAPAVVATRLP